MHVMMCMCVCVCVCVCVSGLCTPQGQWFGPWIVLKPLYVEAEPRAGTWTMLKCGF